VLDLDLIEDTGEGRKLREGKMAKQSISHKLKSEEFSIEGEE
jgi:hypothetical protein